MWMVTYAVAEHHGQEHGHSHGTQGSTPPGTHLGGLLELEGTPRECVAGQGPGGRGVHSPGRHGVAWGCRAEERSRAGTCLEEKVPERKRRNERNSHRLRHSDDKDDTFIIKYIHGDTNKVSLSEADVPPHSPFSIPTSLLQII